MTSLDSFGVHVGALDLCVCVYIITQRCDLPLPYVGYDEFGPVGQKDKFMPVHDECTIETTLTFWRKPDRNRMRFIASDYKKKNRMYAVNNLFVHMKVGSE